MILNPSLEISFSNKNDFAITKLNPQLKLALRQLDRMKLHEELFTSIYFSNGDVVFELEQKLWGRVLLVFSAYSDLDIGCVNMPAKLLNLQCFIDPDLNLNPNLNLNANANLNMEDVVRFQMQFDSGDVTLSFSQLKIQKILKPKGYLQELENRLATDAILAQHEFDYGLFFRVAAQNLREKSRMCGNQHLRKGERDLLILDHFVLAQMHDLFRGRLILKNFKNVTKQQRLNPLHWNRLIVLLGVCGPPELLALAQRAHAIMTEIPWSSSDWADAFSALNADFELQYGEYGFNAHPIYQAFCLYVLQQSGVTL